MKSPVESPTEGTAAVVYGGNTAALDAEIYDDDDRTRLDGVIKDVIEDHGLQGADKERAEAFTRKVGLSVPPLKRCPAISKASAGYIIFDETRRCNRQHSFPQASSVCTLCAYDTISMRSMFIYRMYALFAVDVRMYIRQSMIYFIM